MTNDTGMNSTPLSERVQIGIFGRVNAGKSTIMNVLTGQNAAVVAEKEGTTTDPVRRAMEILPIGPVMIYDTPGLSDKSELGALREEKTAEIIRRCDIAIIVIDSLAAMERSFELTLEKELLEGFLDRRASFLVIAGKSDLLTAAQQKGSVEMIAKTLDISPDDIISFSGISPSASEVTRLRERIAAIRAKSPGAAPRRLIGDLIDEGDVVVLVVPIDESAPKGRIILPQQQVIRDILDSGAIAAVTQPARLKETIDRFGMPRLVVTDSQVFAEVSRIIPRDAALTSFSILMARYKGDLSWQIQGAKALDSLKPGANILISEGCTHHRQCKDIGTVKLPGWIRDFTGREFNYYFTSGTEFVSENEGMGDAPGLSDIDLIIHCGGCTLPEREMKWRIDAARKMNVPITNYGTVIAYMHGILDRATEIFGAGYRQRDTSTFGSAFDRCKLGTVTK